MPRVDTLDLTGTRVIKAGDLFRVYGSRVEYRLRWVNVDEQGRTVSVEGVAVNPHYGGDGYRCFRPEVVRSKVQRSKARGQED